MKALIFSDSHGRTENLVKAMDRHPDFQAIFHLGDVGNDEAYIRSLTPYPVYMVRGNCDFSSSLKESMVIEFGGKRIAMCHGHRYLSYGGRRTLCATLGCKIMPMLLCLDIRMCRI